MTLCIKNARHLEAPVDLLVDGDRILTMTPAGSRVRGAQSRTLTPSRCSRRTLERATRLWAMSPRISRVRPAKLSPQTWRRLKQSSRAWVG